MFASRALICYWWQKLNANLLFYQIICGSRYTLIKLKKTEADRKTTGVKAQRGGSSRLVSQWTSQPLVSLNPSKGGEWFIRVVGLVVRGHSSDFPLALHTRVKQQKHVHALVCSRALYKKIFHISHKRKQINWEILSERFYFHSQISFPKWKEKLHVTYFVETHLVVIQTSLRSLRYYHEQWEQRNNLHQQECSKNRCSEETMCV